MRRLAWAAAVLCLLAGCGGAGKVDPRQVDGKLLDYLHQTRAGVTVDVACPGGVAIRSGARFACSVVLDGDRMSYTVTIDHVAGANYDIAAEPTEPIFDTQQVASAVKQQEGPGTTVDCGSARFVQVPVHGTFSCKVAVGGVHETLTATVTDAKGNVSFATGSGAASGGGGTTTTVTLPGGG